jgi:hypothetical protein
MIRDPRSIQSAVGIYLSGQHVYHLLERNARPQCLIARIRLNDTPRCPIYQVLYSREGVLYSWWYGYVHTSVSRAFQYTHRGRIHIGFFYIIRSHMVFRMFGLL